MTDAPSSPLDEGSEVVFRYEKDGFKIYESLESGLMFVHPQPTQEELNRYYEQAFFKRGNKYQAASGSRTSDPQFDNDQKKIAFVKNFSGGGKLLDVGCALGGFMSVARENGFQVEGLEVSQYAAEYAERELGVKVYKTDLPAAQLPSQSYDVVTMWDVIEHLRDLDGTLAEVSRILKPGGWFFVATGDIGSRYARMVGGRWHLLTPPLHLFYFTQPSLRKVLARHGLATENVTYFGKSASLDFCLFKAQETFGALAKVLRSILKPVAGTKLRINLRDVMTAAARKK